MPEFVILANPVSGSHASPALATSVLELLRAAGRESELRVTTAAGDARRWAGEAVAAGARVVVGCGGDGTLQEIATALDSTPAAMGILPRGRCNDFAQALGLSKKMSAQDLAQKLLHSPPRAVDLGAMGEKRFLTVATLGFDSHVSRFVETRNLWVKGTLAYIYGVLRVLPGFEFPRVRLRGDFGEIDERLLLAATGNAPCYGGAMKIAPAALLDDGQFDICIVRKIPRWSVLPILPRVIAGSHVTHPAVSMVRSTRLEIETPGGPEYICADGETLGQTPCVFEVRPGALRVIA